MRVRITGSAIALVLSLLLVLVSCSRDPQARKQKYFQNGQRYFQRQGRRVGDRVHNAINIDPQFAEAHHQLALTYLQLHKPEDALQEFGRTLQLDRTTTKPGWNWQIGWSLGHHLHEAEDEVNLLMKQRPK